MPLFIGGPMDGQHIEVEQRLPSIAIKIQPHEHASLSEAKETVGFDQFIYRQEILSCPSSRYRVYVPQDYSCEQVMTALLNGYKRKEN